MTVSLGPDHPFDRHSCIAAVDQLAGFATDLTYCSIPEGVRTRLRVLLTDLFGVTIAGSRTPEVRRLVDSWRPAPGTAPLLGAHRSTDTETAALLNAVAACCLELDEGNKHAQGHPAVHVVFAAMAAAQAAERPVSGQKFLNAVAAGYEVAARFGAALERHAPWHTHGHWGAAGAACAVALLHDASEAETAAAIDAATGLMHVTPWSMVLDGNFTRNLWVGGANLAGLHAVRLARAGLVQNTGAAASSLGELVGSLNTDTLTVSLGSEWLLTQGYSKRHASCSYTHAAIDVIQDLKSRHHLDVAQVAAVDVTTHSLTRPLFGRRIGNRLAAMFSLPFVVAMATVNDAVDPQTMHPGHPGFEKARRFMDKVSVAVEPEFDQRLPDERWTEVEIRLHDGRSYRGSQPNPIGDTDYFPLGEEQTEGKIAALIGPGDARHVIATLRGVSTLADVRCAFDALA